MVRIRLRRVGAKKQPYYRVVVADHRSPRDGRHIETIGYYDPRTQPETVAIKEDRALYWLSVGAQPTDVVQRFLDKQGTMERLIRLKTGESLEALIAEYEASAGVEEEVKPVEMEPEEAQPVEAVAEVSAEAAEAEAEAEAAAELDAGEAEAEAEVSAEPEGSEEEAESDDED
jgi:small subunit ribosomal protein S16